MVLLRNAPFPLRRKVFRRPPTFSFGYYSPNSRRFDKIKSTPLHLGPIRRSWLWELPLPSFLLRYGDTVKIISSVYKRAGFQPYFAISVSAAPWNVLGVFLSSTWNILKHCYHPWDMNTLIYHSSCEVWVLHLPLFQSVGVNFLASPSEFIQSSLWIPWYSSRMITIFRRLCSITNFFVSPFYIFRVTSGVQSVFSGSAMSACTFFNVSWWI